MTAMTAVRAVIVDYAGKTPTVMLATDRDQIGKAIRQGGRAIWLDVTETDAPSELRDWLAETVKVPRATFERILPFCDPEPLSLGFALPALNRRDGAGGQSALATWIITRGSVLLTVHSGAFTGWNAIFEAAQAQTPQWQTNFNGTLYDLVKALVDSTEQSLDFATSQYNAMRADVFTEQSTPNYADMAIPVYRWQSNVATMRDQLSSAYWMLNHFYNKLLEKQAEAEQDALWPFSALMTRFDTAYNKFKRAFADAERLSLLLDTLPSGTQTKTTAALIEQMKALDNRVQRFSRVAWTAIALLVGILAALAILVLRGRGL
jgi:Mg2+ and Co2+ transporter CorA